MPSLAPRSPGALRAGVRSTRVMSTHDLVLSRTGARPPISTMWVGYNIFRLVGVTFMAWALVAQFILLVDEVRGGGAMLDAQEGVAVAAAAGSVTGAAPQGESVIGTPTLGYSTAFGNLGRVTSVTTIRWVVTPTPGPTGLVPLVGGGEVLGRRVVDAPARGREGLERRTESAMADSASTPMLERAELPVMAAISRIILACGLGVLVLAQIGIPETWLHDHLAWLGPQSTPLFLGACQLVTAIESLRAPARLAVNLTGAWGTLGVGAANVVLGCFILLRARALPPHPPPALYLAHATRLLYNRALPAFYAPLFRPDLPLHSVANDPHAVGPGAEAQSGTDEDWQLVEKSELAHHAHAPAPATTSRAHAPGFVSSLGGASALPLPEPSTHPMWNDELGAEQDVRQGGYPTFSGAGLGEGGRQVPAAIMDVEMESAGTGRGRRGRMQVGAVTVRHEEGEMPGRMVQAEVGRGSGVKRERERKTDPGGGMGVEGRTASRPATAHSLLPPIRVGAAGAPLLPVADLGAQLRASKTSQRAHGRDKTSAAKDESGSPSSLDSHGSAYSGLAYDAPAHTSKEAEQEGKSRARTHGKAEDRTKAKDKTRDKDKAKGKEKGKPRSATSKRSKDQDRARRLDKVEEGYRKSVDLAAKDMVLGPHYFPLPPERCGSPGSGSVVRTGIPRPVSISAVGGSSADSSHPRQSRRGPERLSSLDGKVARHVPSAYLAKGPSSPGVTYTHAFTPTPIRTIGAGISSSPPSLRAPPTPRTPRTPRTPQPQNPTQMAYTPTGAVGATPRTPLLTLSPAPSPESEVSPAESPLTPAQVARAQKGTMMPGRVYDPQMIPTRGGVGAAASPSAPLNQAPDLLPAPARKRRPDTSSAEDDPARVSSRAARPARPPSAMKHASPPSHARASPPDKAVRGVRFALSPLPETSEPPTPTPASPAVPLSGLRIPGTNMRVFGGLLAAMSPLSTGSEHVVESDANVRRARRGSAQFSHERAEEDVSQARERPRSFYG